MMDLVTLVTACALGAEPKLMHALVWHQSGGEPWAVSVQSEPNPRVYSSMQGSDPRDARKLRRKRYSPRRPSGSCCRSIKGRASGVSAMP
jgi:hypothetical protein